MRRVLGVAMGIAYWLKAGAPTTPWSVALLAATVAGCTWGAIRHGDAFWIGLFGRR